MQGEGSGVIFILLQDREVKWFAWGQAGIWRQRQHRAVLKDPRSWGPSRTPLSSLQKLLGSFPARGPASWQQGSAGFQEKSSKQGVASTVWRWGWAPGHMPACMVGLLSFVQQYSKPNIPCAHEFEPQPASSPGKWAYSKPCALWLFVPKSLCGISQCQLKGLYPRVELGITANTSCFTSPNISSFARP